MSSGTRRSSTRASSPRTTATSNGLAALSDDAIAMGERLGVEFYVAASSGFRGRIEALAGDWRAAERFTRREHDILERLGDEGHRSTTSANLAVVLCELGDMEEAESLAEAGSPPGGR